MIYRAVLSACLFGLLMLHAPAIAAGDKMIVEGWELCAVNLSPGVALTVHVEPRANAAVVAVRHYGECGMTLTAACQGGWCQVGLDGITGWVEEQYIAGVPPPAHCNAFQGERLDMHRDPSPLSPIVGALEHGQCGLSLLPYWMGGWQRIRSEDGMVGWVPAEYLWAE